MRLGLGLGLGVGLGLRLGLGFGLADRGEGGAVVRGCLHLVRGWGGGSG